MHLVLPERPLFSREKVEPSASIALKVRGTLERNRCAPSATSSRRPSMDSSLSGFLSLTRQATSGGGIATVLQAGSAVVGLSARHHSSGGLREQVESIVSSVVGPGARGCS